MITYELWFKGFVNITDDFTPIKEHSGRLRPDDFLFFVEKFIHQRRLNTKNLSMYAVVVFDSYDENSKPIELHDLKTWAIESNLVLVSIPSDGIECLLNSDLSYDSIFSSFKLTDGYALQSAIRDARNRSMLCR